MEVLHAGLCQYVKICSDIGMYYTVLHVALFMSLCSLLLLLFTVLKL